MRQVRLQIFSLILHLFLGVLAESCYYPEALSNRGICNTKIKKDPEIQTDVVRSRSEDKQTTNGRMAKIIAVDFEVFGRVQGVFFRKYTQDKGKELKLVGWCRNTNRNTVQGHMQGPADAVLVMKDWLRKTGSPSSRITKAEFSNEKEIEAVSYSMFMIKH